MKEYNYNLTPQQTKSLDELAEDIVFVNSKDFGTNYGGFYAIKWEVDSHYPLQGYQKLK